MFEVKTLNKISAIGLDTFDKAKYTCGDNFENPDAILVRSASMHDMEFGDNLKAIARAGAGTNNIPVEECVKKGIVVFNTPGANANAVKELVLSALLLSSRKISQALGWVQGLKGQGAEVGKAVEKGKSQFAGPEIKGKTLGVIGLGAIGGLIANAASSLGMKVLGYDPYLSVDGAWNLKSNIVHCKSMSEVLNNSDYVTLHVPLTPETKDTINKASLASMKKGVRILNFSRADLVNSEDIIEAVNNGDVSCYVTDFPTDEILGVENIIAIPHLGASTPESEDNCACMAAEEISDYLENGNIRNSVNLPNVSNPRTTAVRVCVIHKNIPNTLSTISSVFSDTGINIETMVNKSKKDYAYTMVDICADATPDAIEKIQAIEGVIKVSVYR